MTSFSPELWRKVFSHATDVSGALDTRCRPRYWEHYRFTSKPAPDPNFQLYKLRYEESLQTKLALSIVCRLWHEIVAEFLFELLILGDNPLKHLARYLDSLDPSASNPLRYVRRLDVYDKSATSRLNIAGFTSVLKQCTHLQVYRNLDRHKFKRLGGSPILKVWPILLQTCASTLRSVEFGFTIFPKLFADTLFPSILHVEVLCMVEQLEGRCFLEPDFSPVFPNLHTLYLRDALALQSVAQWSFPRLQCLMLQQSSPPQAEPSPGLAASICNNLRILDVRNHLPLTLRTVLDCYPNLETLFCASTTRWGGPDDMEQCYPALREVWIHCAVYRSWLELSHAVTRFGNRASFPNLESLYIERCADVSADWFIRWARELHAINISLDDDRGFVRRAFFPELAIKPTMEDTDGDWWAPLNAGKMPHGFAPRQLVSDPSGSTRLKTPGLTFDALGFRRSRKKTAYD